MEKRKKGIRIIIGRNFNARTREEGGRVNGRSWKKGEEEGNPRTR